MIEDLQGQFKTIYKEFPYDFYGISTVPFLDLNAPPGCSPFLDSETMRKHKEIQRQFHQRKRGKLSTNFKRTTTPPASQMRRDARRRQTTSKVVTQDSWMNEAGTVELAPQPSRLPQNYPTGSLATSHYASISVHNSPFTSYPSVSPALCGAEGSLYIWKTQQNH